MHFWTTMFLIILVVFVFGYLAIARLSRLVELKGGSDSNKEIQDLKDRINKLESLLDNDIEGRVKSIETIISDRDQMLNEQIRVALESGSKKKDKDE